MPTILNMRLDLRGKSVLNTDWQIEQGAVGVRFVVQLLDDGDIVDISAATTLEICLRAPSGGDKVKTATFTNTGSDGKIQFDTVVTDLDELGRWKVGAHVIAPTYERKTPTSALLTVVNSICP
jgi:hypothetical protein